MRLLFGLALSAMAAIPALAADPSAYVSKLARAAPAEMEIVAEGAMPPSPPKVSFSSQNGALKVVRTFTLPNGQTRNVTETYRFRAGAGAEVLMDMALEGPGAPLSFNCAGRFVNDATLDMRCWAPADFAARQASAARGAVIWTVDASGITLRSAPPSGVGGAVFRIKAPVPAPGPAPAVKTAAPRPDLKPGFANALAQIAVHGPEGVKGGLAGDSTVAGRRMMALVKVQNVSNLNFRVEVGVISLGALKPHDEVVEWDLKFAGETGGTMRWTATSKKPRLASDPLVTHLCLGDSSSAGRGAFLITCRRKALLDTIGAMAPVSASFLFKPYPEFALDVGEGTDNLFAIKVTSDLKTR